MKKSDNTRIVFRADGNSKIGLGHIFRSLSVIEMLKSEFDCLFIINRPDPGLVRIIDSYCNVVALNAMTVSEEIKEINEKLHSTDIVVTDGYQFDENYQQFIKSKVRKLVMIDDMADHHYYADLIINHGDASVTNKYRKESYTKVCAGFPYAIMRKEFLAEAKIEKKVSKVNTVFICMGGADPFNITVKVTIACLKCSFLSDIIVVTGSAYNNKHVLNEVLENNKNKKIVYEESVTGHRMVELLKMSEIAIAPASSIAIEICSVKAGLISGTVINNQKAIHQQLVDSGCCLSLGDFNTVSEEDIINALERLNSCNHILSIMDKQAAAIDGFSGQRILNEVKKLVI